MDNLDIFENASKYFLEKMTEFKEILSSKVDSLNNKDWILSKGSTKTCKADETGKKKRCKVGKAYVENIERISNNEEIARYEFLARSSVGDEIRCTIYLANEWNIPQISLLGFVAPRYKKSDY